MNRLVYIGGFGNPNSSVGRVGEALMIHLGFEDMAAFTLGYALDEPGMVKKALSGEFGVTHSGGALPALSGVAAKELHIFNGPLPSGRLRQIGQTVARGLKERDLNSVNGPLRVDNGFINDVIDNPRRHLGPFLTGLISRFNAIEGAIAANNAGVLVGMAYSDRDCYFHPTKEQIKQARHNGVRVAEIADVHDALVLRPAETFDNYLNNRH